MAGPPEKTSQYLRVMGTLAQLVKETDVANLLVKIETPEDFLQLMDVKLIGEPCSES